MKGQLAKLCCDIGELRIIAIDGQCNFEDHHGYVEYMKL